YLDTTRTHRQSNGVLYEFEQTTDGKFLCTGTMTTYENHPVARIFRIQPDGDLDISFEANIDDNWGEAFVFRTLDNGMILAGGMFRQGGSTADTLCLIRLNSSGELDPSFEQLRFKATFTAGSPIPYVVDILPMADGRYVITGRFDRINDEERGGIALIGSDGELLEDAFAGEGCGPYDYQGTIYKSISGIVPIDDGSYYIHGAYHGYDDGTTNDTQQRMVSRLFGLDVGMQESDGAERVHLYPDPTGSNATLQLDALPRSATLVVRDALGREVQRRRITDHYTTLTLQGASGVFMVEVWDANGRIATERLVVE
ncbi:MAG TPA: T9SS type A sorting domain-containing protein, partial [Flavobacteriales bacterium]|nr:T9SS type A sorting domain-containing protein [Flavobacteriales bacterium]